MFLKQFNLYCLQHWPQVNAYFADIFNFKTQDNFLFKIFCHHKPLYTTHFLENLMSVCHNTFKAETAEREVLSWNTFEIHYIIPSLSISVGFPL